MLLHESDELDLLTVLTIKGYGKMQELKDKVVKLLVTDYDFLSEEAETAVAESFSHSPDLWNDKADEKDLAKFLATEDEDE